MANLAWLRWRELAAQKNMTTTGECSYSFVCSWWYVWLTPKTCRVNLQNNKQTALCCISLDNYYYRSAMHGTINIKKMILFILHHNTPYTCMCRFWNALTWRSKVRSDSTDWPDRVNIYLFKVSLTVVLVDINLCNIRWVDGKINEELEMLI